MVGVSVFELPTGAVDGSVGSPGQRPHLCELFLQLLPTLTAIGAAIKLAIDAVGKNQIGVGGVGREIPKFQRGEFGSTGNGGVSHDFPPSMDR